MHNRTERVNYDYKRYNFVRRVERALLAVNMDKKRFTTVLRSLVSSKGRRLSDTSVRAYVYSVKRFKKWLQDSGSKRKLDNANKEDVHSFWTHLQKKNTPPRTISLIFVGLSKYYEYRHRREMVKAIEEIQSRLPSPQPIPHKLSWDSFQKIIEVAKNDGLSDEKLTLLNLLWSEMKVPDILGLWISDIDFKNRCITSSNTKEKYGVTKNAWLALENYVPTEDRGAKKELFKIRSARAVQRMTEDYFGLKGQTPLGLRKCCENDLIEAGRTVRFGYKEDRKSGSEAKQEQDEKPITKRDLSFRTLVQEIENFGEKIHERIPKLKDEGELQSLLEAYLYGAFPKETIIHEYGFRDDIGHRWCDIVIGKDRKFGIEVKLADEKIIKPVRDGQRQIKEFLSKYPKSKGIVVVGDKKSDFERREEYTQKKPRDRSWTIVI